MNAFQITDGELYQAGLLPSQPLSFVKGSKLRTVASSPKSAGCSGKWQMHYPPGRDPEPWPLRGLESEILGYRRSSLDDQPLKESFAQTVAPPLL